MSTTSAPKRSTRFGFGPIPTSSLCTTTSELRHLRSGMADVLALAQSDSALRLGFPFRANRWSPRRTRAVSLATAPDRFASKSLDVFPHHRSRYPSREHGAKIPAQKNRTDFTGLDRSRSLHRRRLVHPLLAFRSALGAAGSAGSQRQSGAGPSFSYFIFPGPRVHARQRCIHPRKCRPATHHHREVDDSGFLSWYPGAPPQLRHG